ncbi:hypothetical protein KUF54_01470 [Comamonas sp. Y33R10-2]|nr:hypothetical protein KUF54_01470 [Comamonas sp. Y33R10-2]
MESLQQHHCGRLVQTKVHCIKRLGDRAMSRTVERQVNELHIRPPILNRFTELGRPQTEVGHSHG